MNLLIQEVDIASSELRKVPDQLEALLASKHFVSAVELLNSATSTANRDDLLSIAALTDIRQYFKSQSIAIVEIIVEELHNHLYLKSPYSDSRWAVYTPGQTELPIVLCDKYQDNDKTSNKKLSSMGRLPIDEFRSRETLLEGSIDVDDRNPESDSFHYIQMLSQALDAMGKLPYAADLMLQRIPYEIYQSIERTISEVRLRHKTISTQVTSHRDFLSRTDSEDDASEPLKDLLWTVFSKWDAILQCHCVLYESTVLLQGHYPDKLNRQRSSGAGYELHDIWRPLESEVLSLLGSYLTLHEDRVDKDNLSGAMADMFSEKKTRIRKRGLYSIAHAAKPGDSIYSAEEQELRNMLQGSVPGLLSEKNDQKLILNHETNDNLVTGHSQVSPATPFNITFILEAVLAFLQRAKRILPNTPTLTSDSITHFLNEFLNNIFDAQLSEAVVSAYKDSVDDNLEVRASSGVLPNEEHVSQNEFRVIKLIKQVYTLLSSIPDQRESYAEIMLSVVRRYHQKVQSWLTSLVANPTPDAHLGSLMLGAAWANRQQVKLIWDNYNSSSGVVSALHEATRAEMVFIFEVKKGFVIRQQDLIQDPTKIEQLVTLNRSLNHFVSSLSSLLEKRSLGTDRGLHISSAANKQFDDLLSSFRDLARSILVILRMEFRAHVIYYLQLALCQGNYNIEERANEVDPTIIDLNTDLMLLNTSLSSLPPADYELVTDGLALLIDQVLIEDASSISIMTLHGSEKLILGISALQQNLRNIVSSPENADLSRASTFYTDFSLGPLGLCDKASQLTRSGLTFTQASRLMALMYSADLNKKDNRSNRDSISVRRKQLNESLSLLSAKMNPTEHS